MFLREIVISPDNYRESLVISRVTKVLPPAPLQRGRINASSIAEVVIALTIIALCFGIASLIFIRSMSVTSRFQDVKEQTELQSKILESFYKDNDSIPVLEVGDLTITNTSDESNDSLKVIEFLGMDDRLIWKQQIVKK